MAAHIHHSGITNRHAAMTLLSSGLRPSAPPPTWGDNNPTRPPGAPPPLRLNTKTKVKVNPGRASAPRGAATAQQTATQTRKQQAHVNPEAPALHAARDGTAARQQQTEEAANTTARAQQPTLRHAVVRPA